MSRIGCDASQLRNAETIMNQVRQELEKCMTEMNVGENSQIQACFTFPETFVGFQGHFPEQPVLPGICMIQAALCILSTWKKRPVHLCEIAMAKYYKIIIPNEKVDFNGREKPDDTCSAKVTIQLIADDKRVAELRLRVEYA